MDRADVEAAVCAILFLLRQNLQPVDKEDAVMHFNSYEEEKNMGQHSPVL